MAWSYREFCPRPIGGVHGKMSTPMPYCYSPSSVPLSFVWSMLYFILVHEQSQNAHCFQPDEKLFQMHDITSRFIFLSSQSIVILSSVWPVWFVVDFRCWFTTRCLFCHWLCHNSCLRHFALSLRSVTSFIRSFIYCPTSHDLIIMPPSLGHLHI